MRPYPQIIAAFLPLSAMAGDLPEVVTGDHFNAFLTRSPFLRTLSLTETYSLRGVATIGEETVATLYNRQTKKPLVVSEAGRNEWGLRLVGVAGSANLSGVAVRFAMSDEEFELKYEPERVAPAPKGGSGKRDEVKYDSRGRAIPPQSLIDQYRSMTDSQRATYMKWREAYYQKHPDLENSEKRFPIAEKAIEAVKAGKEPPKS